MSNSGNTPLGKNPQERIAASVGATGVSELLLGVKQGASADEIKEAVAKMLDKNERGFFTFDATVFGQMLAVARQVLQAIKSAA